MRVVLGKDNTRSSRRGISGVRLLVSAMVPILCLFIQYPGVFNTLGLTIALILSVYCLITQPEIPICRPFALFLLFYLARLFVNFFSPHGSFSQENIMNYLVIAAVGGCALILAGFVDQDIMFQVWRFIGICVFIAIVYQSIQINVLGQPAHLIKLLPVRLRMQVWYQATARPAAFFTEPAVLSAYMSPLLHMSLYRRKFFFAALVTVTILLSTSTLGILTVAILWLHFIVANRNLTPLTRTLLLIVSVTLAVTVMSLPIFSSTFAKLIQEIEGTNNSYMRTMMGYDYFRQLTVPEQIFGIFEPNIRRLLLSGRISIPYFLALDQYNYVNSIQQLLLTCGLLGVFALFWAYYHMLRTGSHQLRGYVFLQIILMFGGRMFFNSLSLIPFLFMLSLCDHSSQYVLRLRHRHYRVAPRETRL